MITQALQRASDHPKFPLYERLVELSLALLKSKERDVLISYADIAEAIGCDVRTDVRSRTAFLKACKILLRENLRKVVNERNKGYRIVRDDERRHVAKREEASSYRRISAAVETVTRVAIDELGPVEASLLLTEQARMAMIEAIHRKLRKVKKLPNRSDVSVPSGSKLVEMMKKA